MIPKVNLENLKLSKVVCGTNQFMGITHRGNPIDIYFHMRRFKEASTVAKYMIYLVQNHGVNCCVSSPRDKIYEAMQITMKETGEKMYWLCTPSRRGTAKDLLSDVFNQIDWCVDHEVAVCMPHRDYTDHALDKQKLVIGGNAKDLPPYPDVAAYIRDKGMIPGLSTHYIETIEAVEKNKYDAPLIIQPLNKIGFESDTDPETLTKKIQSTKIQILAIKPMAAGRIKPDIGIPWALERIKPNDFIAVGHGKYKFIVENGIMLDKLLNS